MSLLTRKVFSPLLSLCLKDVIQHHESVTVMKITDPGHLHAVWRWASYVTSLGLSFLVCLVGMVLYLPHRVLVRTEWDSANDVLLPVLGTYKLSAKAVLTHN